MPDKNENGRRPSIATRFSDHQRRRADELLCDLKIAEAARLSAEARATKLQGFVSYRLGELITSSLASPRDILMLPWRLFQFSRQLKTDLKPGHEPRVATHQMHSNHLPRQVFISRKPHTLSLPYAGEGGLVLDCRIDCYAQELPTVYAKATFLNGAGRVIGGGGTGGGGNDLAGANEGVEDPQSNSRKLRLPVGPDAQFSLNFSPPQDCKSIALELSSSGRSAVVRLRFEQLKTCSPASDLFSLVFEGEELMPMHLPHHEFYENGPDKPRFASILDEFTHSCFEPLIDLLPLGRHNWRSILDDKKPSALLIEAAWNGNDRAWRLALSKYETSPAGKELHQVLEHSGRRAIPRIFWNKEDPVNFETFLPVARDFDHVFTTDAHCVARYREMLGHDRAHVLPFAAETSLHNPIGSSMHQRRIAFAGSWRGEKYPKRAAVLAELMAEPLARGQLDIYDRYSIEPTNPDFIFPKKFHTAMRGGLDYHDLIDMVYKRSLAMINVNSVENSPTMLARRVFEVLACGTPVISSPSPALERFFGDVVLVAETRADVANHLDRLEADPMERARLGVRGVRAVHSQHTYTHRLDQISETVGLPALNRGARKVSILCVSKRADQLDHVISQIEGQVDVEFELIYVRHFKNDEKKSSQLDPLDRLEKLANVTKLELAENFVLADGLNQAMKVANGNILAKFDDDDYYGPNYLADAILAFDYSGAGIVGKHSYHAYIEDRDQTVIRFPDKAYGYTELVHGATLIWDRQSDARKLDFPQICRGTDTGFLATARQKGIAVFSSDPFNFLHVRHKDKAQHTWQISDNEFCADTTLIGSGKALTQVFV